MSEETALRILLIEDNRSDVQIFCRYAAESKLYRIEVDHVTTSEQALHRLSEGQYALVFLDQRLGEAVTGLDILRRVRAAGSELPAIIITGTGNEQMAVEMMKSGAVDYLVKDNFNREVLERSVRYALERRRQAAERKKADQRLRESEARFRTLFEGIPEAVLVHDGEGNILHTNDVGAQRLEWPPAELVGKNLREIVTPENAALIADHVRGAITQGSCSFETTYVSRTGRHIKAEVNECPIQFEGKSAILSAARDITERKRAEEALRQSEERLSRFMESSPDGFCLFDSELNFLELNRAALEMFGLTKEETIGKNILDIVPNLEETGRYDKYLEVIKTGEPFFVDDLVPDPKFGDKHLVLSAFRVGGGLGVITTDISESKALEEQLRHSQKMEAIGRLAGGVAHDFNNLLVVINGCARLILAALEPDSPIHRDVEEIIKAGGRAEELTHQLQAFGRRQTLQTRIINLNEVVEHLGKMLRRVIGEDVDLAIMLPEDVGNVEADPGQIEQVLMNLAVNARDAMPNGGKLTIETANVMLDKQYAGSHRGVKPGPYVMLAMTDTGGGMEEETRERIFEPFFTTKEEGRGTGLGLSTVYGIVKQHDGKIWVYSEPGQGTTFKIYLPRVDAEAEGLAAKADEGFTVTGSETILVVEDEEAVLWTVQAMLEEHGYRVLTATCPEEAGQIFAQHSSEVALLLTDVVMPECTGRDLYARLAGQHPSLKVLYMSGYTDNAIARRGMLEPGTDFLQKPFSLDTLAKKVREVLDR